MSSDHSIGFGYRRELPNEFRVLCVLHNVGATTLERALSVEEMSKWARADTSFVRTHIQKLRELGYVQSAQVEGVEKYYLTLSGLRKVLSIYS